MTKKRDRLEVIYDILKVIEKNKNHIRPTPLLRYSNLSSQRFAEYYNDLMANGFIREIEDDKGKKFLTLTDKGFKYLERYVAIVDFIEDFDL